MRVDRNNILLSQRLSQQQAPQKTITDHKNTLFGNEVTKQKTEAGSNVLSSPPIAVSDILRKLSGEDYLNLQQESAAAYSPEMKSAAEHQALIASADNAAFEPANVVNEALISDKAETCNIPPIPDFSGMSDSQKLSTLRKLHDATDYSNMTPVERYKLIHERVEAAFPNAMAIRSGLYGPGVYYHDKSITPRKTLSDLLYDEIHHQQKEAGMGGMKLKDLRREAFYSGLSDEEVIAAVNQRHSGNSVEARAATLYELSCLDLDNGIGLQAISAMSKSLLSRVRGEKVYGAVNEVPRNPMEISMMVSLAGGTRMSWGEVGSMVLSSSYEYAISCSDPALALKEHEEFQEKWNDLLELLMQAGS